MAVQNIYTDIDLFKVSQLLNFRVHNVTTSQRISLGNTLSNLHKGLEVWDITVNTPFYWTGIAWSTSVSSVSWGSISGNIDDQIDLITILNLKANTSDLSNVAFTGAYNDLSGKPILAAVATSGQYNDLIGKPVLATVAITGSYNDLIDKPVIPPGTNPAGSNTQIQYNNGGLFGASPNFTWDNAQSTLLIGGASQVLLSSERLIFNYDASHGGDITGSFNNIEQLSIGFNNLAYFGGTSADSSGRVLYFFDRIQSRFVAGIGDSGFYIGDSNTNYGLAVERPNTGVSSVKIQSDGNVIVNGQITSITDNNLIVKQINSPLTGLSIQSSDSVTRAGFWMSNGSGEVRIGAFTNGGYYPTFYSNGTEMMRLSSNGNLLLAGTIDDGVNALQVTGNIKNTGDILSDSLSGVGERSIVADSTGKLKIGSNSSSSFSLPPNTSSTSTLSLDITKSNYIFTGTTATWSLPIVTGNDGLFYFIKNRGTGILTIDVIDTSSTIYTTLAVNGQVLNPGDAFIFSNDGTYWNVQ